MARILWLHLATNEPWQVYRRFTERVRSLGHQLEAFEIGGSEEEREQQLNDGVLAADAFVLTDLSDVLGSTGLGDRVWSQVEFSVKRWEKRLLVLNADQEMNARLDTFDMQVSSHKLFPITPDELPGRRFVVRADDQPVSQRIPELFGGVEEIVLASPWLLRTVGDALPMLSCPAEAQLIDRGDRFVHTGDLSRVCGGYWAPDPRSPPRVMVIAAGCFHDSGFDRNLAFATNMIEWHVGHDWPMSSLEAANRFVDATELSLRKLIEVVLRKSSGEEWFGGLPSELRHRLEERCRKAGMHLDPFDYAGLRDLVMVISRRWETFEDVLTEYQKRDLVSRLHRLADLRNRLKHPSRAQKDPPHEDEITTARELYEVVRMGLRRAQEDVDD